MEASRTVRSRPASGAEGSSIARCSSAGSTASRGSERERENELPALVPSDFIFVHNGRHPSALLNAPTLEPARARHIAAAQLPKHAAGKKKPLPRIGMREEALLQDEHNGAVQAQEKQPQQQQLHDEPQQIQAAENEALAQLQAHLGSDDADEILEVVMTQATHMDSALGRLASKMAVKSPDNSDHLNLLRKRLRMIFSGVESAATLMQEELGLTSELNRQLGLQLRHYAAQIQQSLGALRLVEADAVEMASGKGPRPMHEDMRPLANIQPSSDAAHELRDLYELQRHRMTAEIEALKKERDSWFEASYALCGAMADQHDMHTLRILRLRQETWRNLCIQSVLHVHRSTSRQLDKLRETVSEFKHEMTNACRDLSADDEETAERLRSLREEIESLLASLRRQQRHIPLANTDGKDATRTESAESVIMQSVLHLHAQCQQWQSTLSRVVDDLSERRAQQFAHQRIGLERYMEHWTKLADSVLQTLMSAVKSRNTVKMTALNSEIRSMFDRVATNLSTSSSAADALVDVLTRIGAFAIELSRIQTENVSEGTLQTLLEHLSLWSRLMEKAIEQLSRPLGLRALFSQADDWVLAVVLDAQAHNTRISELIEKENRSMTQWLVVLEQCIFGVKGVSIAITAESLQDVTSGLQFATKEITDSCMPVVEDMLHSEDAEKAEEIKKAGQAALATLDQVHQQFHSWMSAAETIITKLRTADLEGRALLKTAQEHDDDVEDCDVTAASAGNLMAAGSGPGRSRGTGDFQGLEEEPWDALEGRQLVGVTSEGHLKPVNVPDYEQLRPSTPGNADREVREQRASE